MITDISQMGAGKYQFNVYDILNQKLIRVIVPKIYNLSFVEMKPFSDTQIAVLFTSSQMAQVLLIDLST